MDTKFECGLLWVPLCTWQVPDLYFERQVQARCGMHALNNAVGRQVFKVEDMTLAIEAFLAEGFDGDGEAAEHYRPGGWYSVPVLYTACVVKGLALNLSSPLTGKGQLQKLTCAVQCRRGRYAALRRVGGKLWCLDSLKEGPDAVDLNELTREAKVCPVYRLRWT